MSDLVPPSNAVLTFTSDWQQFVIGTLEPGSRALIGYDSNRLPNNRSTYNGAPTWSIIAFYRFAPDAPIQQVTLAAATAGIVPAPQQTVTLGSSFMYAAFDVPSEAESLEIWFLNGGQGLQYWDSDYGRNYQFRFPKADIGTVLANIVTSTPTPYSGFDVQLDQVTLAATSVAVNYQVTNVDPGNVFFDGSTANLEQRTVERGRAVWSGRTIVPLRANIIFTISYTVGNQTYLATNGGAGYTAIGDPAVVGTEAPVATDAVTPPSRLPVQA